jgi:hypothetical protein
MLAIVIPVAFLPIIVLPVMIMVPSHVRSVKIEPVVVTPPVYKSPGTTIVIPAVVISLDGKPGIRMDDQ